MAPGVPAAVQMSNVLLSFHLPTNVRAIERADEVIRIERLSSFLFLVASTSSRGHTDLRHWVQTAVGVDGRAVSGLPVSAREVSEEPSGARSSPS